MDAEQILRDLRDPSHWDLEPKLRDGRIGIQRSRRSLVLSLVTIAIAAVAAVAIFTALGLGIRSVRAPEPAVPPSTPTGAASSTPPPRAQTERVIPIPDGVVATGTFRSGEVTVEKAGDTFFLTITGAAASKSGHRLIAIADSRVSGECAEGNVYQAASDQIPSPTVDDYGTGDPSFWKTVLIVQYPTAVSGGCSQPILDRATLNWTVPSTHPDLRVDDSGVQSGAGGAVTSTSGSPSTYVTASGDTWSAIAHRFGITESDLAWLNPIRHPGTAQGAAGTAYSGQKLNLDPANRGNSETRRAYAP